MAALIRRLHSQRPDSRQEVVVDRFNPMGYGGAVQRGQPGRVRHHESLQPGCA